MDGIGLDNMLGAEEVRRIFGGQNASEEETPQEQETGEETPVEAEENSDTTETAEDDFSTFLGNQPESVGSEENTEGNGGAPESTNGSGTPQQNLFSSIARILRDKGVFPDLSDKSLEEINDEAALEKLFNDKVDSMLDERQRRLDKALNGGATPDEVKTYNQALTYSSFLESQDTFKKLIAEGGEGETLRKQVMYQDYINRGFKHEKAVKMVQKSFEDGNEIEDAKEALESCKEYYKGIVEDYQQELEARQQQQQANEKKQYASLKKQILDTESFYGGIKVDKNIRQKAYDAITKPVFKDEQGNYLTALQKYQRENPMEFMINMAMMMTLTDNFKSVEKLTKGKIKEGMKKGFAELESVLNSSRRNGDGTLNLANGSADEDGREGWSLAI